MCERQTLIKLTIDFASKYKDWCLTVLHVYQELAIETDNNKLIKKYYVMMQSRRNQVRQINIYLSLHTQLHNVNIN